MLSIENLEALGINTAEGLARCMNNKDFYLRMVQKVIEGDRSEELKNAIDEKDYDRAFDIAHAMKGVYANLSITTVHEPVKEITELLRNRTDTDYSDLIEKILAGCKALKEL